MVQSINEKTIQPLWGFFTKENTEVLLNVFKIILNFSILVGTVWNLMYYGFVVKALPEFDAASLTVFLVSIFGVGLFLIIMIFLFFLSSGLFLYGTAKESKGEDDKVNLRDWLSDKSCCSDFMKGQFLFVAYGIISLLIVNLIDYYKDVPSSMTCIFLFSSSVSFLSIVIVLYLIKLNFIRWFFPLVFSFCIFFISALLVASLAAASQRTSYGLSVFAFFISLTVSVLLNGTLASKGFNFIKSPSHVEKHSFVQSCVGIATIFLGFIIFFSILLSSPNNPSPFLTAPYKALKIGQIKASLTVNEDFAEILKSGSSSQRTFQFTILSGIGKEYIVQYPETKKILRIPKDKVILVAYDE